MASAPNHAKTVAATCAKARKKGQKGDISESGDQL